jgi:hypothetical protein
MTDDKQKTIKAVTKELLFTYPDHNIPTREAEWLLKYVPVLVEEHERIRRNVGV